MSNSNTARAILPREAKTSKHEKLCKSASRSLIRVLNHARDNEQSEELLYDFGHSSNCRRINCTTYCKIFKLLREHVSKATHSCSLLPICTLLLDAHVRLITFRPPKRLNREG